MRYPLRYPATGHIDPVQTTHDNPGAGTAAPEEPVRTGFSFLHDTAQCLFRLMSPGTKTEAFRGEGRHPWTAQTSYDANSRVTANFLANGVTASFSYDNVGQTLLLANVNSAGTTLFSFN